MIKEVSKVYAYRRIKFSNDAIKLFGNGEQIERIVYTLYNNKIVIKILKNKKI